MEIRKGDIYYAELIGSGSVQRGERPVIVSSSDINNRFAPTIQVIPLTSNLNKKRLPVHVEVNTNCGLRETSLALAEQEQTIDKKSLIRKIGTCTDDVIYQIDKAICTQRGMNQEPEEPINLTLLRYLARTVIVCSSLMKKSKPNNQEVIYFNSSLKELKKTCENYGLDYKIILKQEYERDETQCPPKKLVGII